MANSDTPEFIVETSSDWEPHWCIYSERKTEKEAYADLIDLTDGKTDTSIRVIITKIIHKYP